MPRIVLALVISHRYGGTLFDDEKTYFYLIRTYANNQTSEWTDYFHQLWNMSLGFLYPGYLMYKILGSNPLAVLSISVLMGSLIPVAITKLLLKYVSFPVAIVIGICLAVMPSQVLWSSLLVKDGYIVVGFCAIAFLVKWWSQQDDWPKFLYGVFILTLVLFYLQRIRLHSLIIVCVAIFLTTLLGGGKFLLPRLLVVLFLFMLIPSMIGGGYFGSNFARSLGSGLEGQRKAGAVGATAVIEIPTSTVYSSSSSSGSSSSSSSSSVGSSSPAIIGELKYLPSGLKVMLLDPSPSQLSRSRSLYLAFAEHLIWYPALLLCFYGAIRRRKWTADLIFAGLLGIGLCSMWALHEGNFGTAFRHRTEFVWIVFLFAGIGIQQILDDIQKNRTRPPDISAN